VVPGANPSVLVDNDATFGLDALGRFTTRTINGASDNYRYLGTGESVTTITTGATTIASVIDATGPGQG
jgi:hypothetical protein